MRRRMWCPECGKKFAPSYKQQLCCGRSCAAIRRAKLRGLRIKRDAGNQRKLKEERKAKKKSEMELRRERLAARDLAYRESPCAAKVAVECVRTTDGRTLFVETRGQACLGWRSCGHVSHNS